MLKNLRWFAVGAVVGISITLAIPLLVKLARRRKNKTKVLRASGESGDLMTE